MEKSIKIFDNPAFGSIRTVEVDGEVYFIGYDVAKLLGYKNPRDAIANHVDREDKNTVAIYDGIGNPNKTIINESGLYSLILSSKLPKSKEFKRWVTAEVLPSIRKTGGYRLDNLQEIIGITVAETIKQLMPILQQSSTNNKEADEEEEIVIRRARRRTPVGIIAKLPCDLRNEVDDMICSEKYTYKDIVDMLAEEGISISQAAVSRYRQRYLG